MERRRFFSLLFSLKQSVICALYSIATALQLSWSDIVFSLSLLFTKNLPVPFYTRILNNPRWRSDTPSWRLLPKPGTFNFFLLFFSLWRRYAEKNIFRTHCKLRRFDRESGNGTERSGFRVCTGAVEKYRKRGIARVSARVRFSDSKLEFCPENVDRRDTPEVSWKLGVRHT